MISRYLSVFFLALATVHSDAFAISSEPAKEKLRSMAIAARSLAYSGKLVYQRADVLANLAFEHDVTNGQETARLRRLSGQPLERAQSGNSLIEASLQGPTSCVRAIRCLVLLILSHDKFSKRLIRSRLGELSESLIVLRNWSWLSLWMAIATVIAFGLMKRRRCC